MRNSLSGTLSTVLATLGVTAVGMILEAFILRNILTRLIHGVLFHRWSI